MKLFLYFIIAALLVFYIGMPADFDWSNPIQSFQKMAQPRERTQQKTKEKATIEVDSIKSADTIDYASIENNLINNTLREALQLAKGNIGSTWSKKGLRAAGDSIDREVHWQAEMGNFFASDKQHLIIHQHLTSQKEEYINVYEIQGDSFVSVIYHLQDNMSYVSDTITDVNGDGVDDLVINWWLNANCCPSNMSTAYLYQPTKSDFTVGYEFINPTFIADEKSIFGMTYGHEGETDLYHYEWTPSLGIDTIDYLSINQADTINNTYLLKKDAQEFILDSIPFKYQAVDTINYYWFDQHNIYKAPNL